jgi:hypothetical protein
VKKSYDNHHDEIGTHRDHHGEAEAVQSYRSDSGTSSGGTSLGDLLKEHIGSGDRG